LFGSFGDGWASFFVTDSLGRGYRCSTRGRQRRPIILSLQNISIDLQSLKLIDFHFAPSVGATTPVQLGRVKLTPADRIFWVWLRRVWGDWKSRKVKILHRVETTR